MDIALKQRLVGASVLIALAVVVLPMLLGGRPDDGGSETQKIELPPQPSELDFQTRRYPLGDTPATPRPKQAVPEQPESARQAEPRLAAPPAGEDGGASPGDVAHVEIKPREFEDALPAAETPDAAGPGTEPVADVGGADASVAADAPDQASDAGEALAPADAAGGRYIVQVASFGSVDNARRLAGTLRGYGYDVMSDTVASDVGTLHRVRVGPFDTVPDANAAVGRLRNQVSGVKPRVMDLRPDQAAQVTAPADPLVRWVVQVGSFSSADNADKLVERLRGERLTAFKEAVTSSGSTIFRVRAGPFAEREEAIRVSGLIKERLALDGVVMSAD
jgi:DedD protein